MVFFECSFDPVVDIAPVSQVGFIDIVRCISNGDVPAPSSDDDLPYNGVDNPQEVGSIVSDVFEAIRATKAMEHAANVAQSSDPAPSGAKGE